MSLEIKRYISSACDLNMHRYIQGPREDQKSAGSETSNLPKLYSSNQKIHFLLHFHITISKSQGGQLTPLTF